MPPRASVCASRTTASNPRSWGSREPTDWRQLPSGGLAAMMAGMSATTTFDSYEQACRNHRWEVPQRYNIAADVCDRHPRERLAMIHEDFRGDVREVVWGELQDTANQIANVLAAHGVVKGDRVAMLLPP